MLNEEVCSLPVCYVFSTLCFLVNVQRRLVECDSLLFSLSIYDLKYKKNGTREREQSWCLKGFMSMPNCDISCFLKSLKKSAELFGPGAITEEFPKICISWIPKAKDAERIARAKSPAAVLPHSPVVLKWDLSEIQLVLSFLLGTSWKFPKDPRRLLDPHLGNHCYFICNTVKKENVLSWRWR